MPTNLSLQRVIVIFSAVQKYTTRTKKSAMYIIMMDRSDRLDRI